SITIPARPVNAPAAPTGLSATRVSDSRQDLAWTTHGASDAPYVSVEVARRANGGSWVTIASLPAASTSYVDSTTSAGKVYDYAVRASNAAGPSVYSEWATISTPPLRPSAPSAAKTATGDIVVTRPALSQSAATWAVGESGAATLATGIPAAQST